MKKSFILMGACWALLGFFESQAMKVSEEALKKVSSSVVSIKMQQMHNAYGEPQAGVGTGFVVHREQGIIVTNRHIASIEIQTQFMGSFEDGTLVPLSFIWNHPTYDFAFLKADPKDLPPEAQTLDFSRDVKPRQEVFILGNNQSISHSFQTGTLNDIYNQTNLFWPIPSLEINLNTKGGSSGSPVCNKEGLVVGINYGASDTAAVAVPIAYVDDALAYVLKGQLPPARSSGVLLTQMNGNEAADLFDYPKEAIASLKKLQPHGRNRLLVVKRSLSSFEEPEGGQQGLHLGDIIYGIDGKAIGTDFYAWDQAMNEAGDQKVKVTVWRDGQFVDLSIASTDLNPYACGETLDFGGLTFASADPIRSLMKGIPMGSVVVARANPSNILSAPCSLFVQVTKMAGKPVNTLADLKDLVPTLKRYFPVFVREMNFMEVDGTKFDTNQREQFIKGDCDPAFYEEPFTVRFDGPKKTWIRETIAPKVEKN